jgi:nicotinamidase-related amidase
MKLPDTKRKKALIIVDVQEAFLKEHNCHIVENIKNLIVDVKYDAYVEAVFFAEKNSLWEKQQDWYCPKDQNTKTVSSINDLLKDKNCLSMIKSTRSVFGGDKDLVSYLKERNIEEIHLVGTETNDCVLATAFSAFDLGFAVYLIEECCESATPGRHELGLELVRLQSMTNNSCKADTIDI